MAAKVARGSGRASCFVAASVICACWLIGGPFVHWSDSWQLVINTVSSVITFLMVFVIQGSQTRDTDILNAKLNNDPQSAADATSFSASTIWQDGELSFIGSMRIFPNSHGKKPFDEG